MYQGPQLAQALNKAYPQYVFKAALVPSPPGVHNVFAEEVEPERVEEIRAYARGFLEGLKQ
jgi:hypothetical protein